MTIPTSEPMPDNDTIFGPPRHREQAGECTRCGKPWPCLTSQLKPDLPHVDLDSDPHYGYDSVEKFGEPFDAYIKANVDADSGGTCAVCETGIGSNLHDDFTDDGHRFQAIWKWMTLVVIDGQVITLCEECSMPLDPA